MPTEKTLLDYQKRIDKYVAEFKDKSHGYDLGEVRYVKNFFNRSTSIGENAESFFISMPVKNQETTIVEIVQNLIEHTSYDFSLGILFDNCEDESQKIFLEYISNLDLSKTNLIEVHVVSSKRDLFESTSENILSLMCKERFLVSVQADCYLDDATFLSRSLDAFNSDPTLLAISGRATVPFHPLREWQLKRDAVIRGVLSLIKSPLKCEKTLGSHIIARGYFGDTSEFPNRKLKIKESELGNLYVGESVIRGPIVWNFELFLKLKGFNDISFFLGRDECDLCFRGRKFGYVVGYLPSRSYSISENGTTRRPRTLETMKTLQERAFLADTNKGELSEYWISSPRRGHKIRLVEIYTR